MKKYLWIAAAALCGVFAGCSDDDEAGGGGAAVGLLNVEVIPAESAKSYKCTISGLEIVNSTDSVDWDVTDAALANATVKATATVGSTAYYNGNPISADGVEVDATAPITLEARGENGAITTYVLKVVRATSAGNEDMVKKASRDLNGKGMVSFDVAYFKNKFYAIMASVSGETENYQLFSSENGVNWTEIQYNVSTDGVSLPEGQNGYVVGGENATLCVFNDRLYVLGGARTMGKDKYGNEAEINDMGWMVATTISAWRSFSTTDGQTFECDTIGMKYFANGQEMPSAMISRLLPSAGGKAVVFKNRMYLMGTFFPNFGTWQGVGSFYTENGKDWNSYAPAAVAEDGMNVARNNEAAVFTFKGKMWMVGGHKNFIDPGQAVNAIYSTEDGDTWVKEADAPAAIQNIIGLKAVATEDVVYLFGGMSIATAGNYGFAPQMFRSTDGINWEEVAVPETFVPVRQAKVVGVGNQAWLFGGVNTVAAGNYAYPTDLDTWNADTWVKLMK